jgi:hypothetical protein
MAKTLMLAGLTVGVLLGGAVCAAAQVPDIQAREQAYYNRVSTLRTQIAEGWTPAQVLTVMGEPERRRSYADGSDLVDLWGYRGWDVLVEFRNGLVSGWFFRFMP